MRGKVATLHAPRMYLENSKVPVKDPPDVIVKEARFIIEQIK